MPDYHAQVSLVEHTTYPLITQLPDQPLSPMTIERESSTYVVENPPETTSPSCDEQRLNLIIGLSLFLT